MSCHSRYLNRVGVSVCIACVSTFLAIPGPAVAGEADPHWEGRKWEPWTEIGGYAANRSYARRGELALWAPVTQDADSMFFLDLRGKLFAEDQQEGNAAIGYRFMGQGGWNPGLWIGFDRRNTTSGTNFDQVALGVEALSADWDVRANGYVPINDRELISSSGGGGEATIEVIGSSIFLVPAGGTDLYEIAMWGVDAEVGWRVPLERFGYDPTWGLSLKDDGISRSLRHHELRLYAGGFYFDHADFDGEVAGPRARAEWRIENIFEDWDGSRLTFEAAWQHDDVRGHQVEAGVRLRIPLGGGRSVSPRHVLNAQEQRMTEGLKRDTDIVSQQQTVVTGGGGALEPVEDAETGVDFDTVVTVDNGADLQTGITTASHNALIIALGGGSNFGSVAMQSDQTLLGGGGAIEVRGRTSGTVATYTAPGTRPTIAGSTGTVITTADNAHIAGIEVDGAGADYEIRTFGAETVVLSSVRAFDALIGYNPASGSDGSMVAIRDSTIHGTNSGVWIDSASTVEITDSTLEGGLYGLRTNAEVTLTLADTSFVGEPSVALIGFASSNATIVAGSTGNTNATDNDAVECARFFVTFTGTLGFDTGDVTAAECTTP
jgi:hypothetical protein